MKIVICTPTRKRPTKAFLSALETAVPVLEAYGIEHSTVFEVGCPYISHAMAKLTRKALDVNPDRIIYIDDDLSFSPQSLLKIAQATDDVVAGTYRYRKEPEEYMGTVFGDAEGRPLVRGDGCISAEWVPSGFLSLSVAAIGKFMKAYPELEFGPRHHLSIDLFNHGAFEGLWYGQDYAFSRNYQKKCGPIWIIPDLDITHVNREEDGSETPFVGNFHKYLLRQPGGSESESPCPPSYNVGKSAGLQFDPNSLKGAA